MIKEIESKTCELPRQTRIGQEGKIEGALASILGRHRSMKVHAHGLSYPSHMEWTQDGRLLVSEFNSTGKIKDITKGGDCRDIEPFAYNLDHPASILPNDDGRVFVVDNGRGAIYDITEGGNILNLPVIFQGIPGPYGLVSHGNEVYSTFSNRQENGLVKVVENGTFSEDLVFVRGFSRGVRETVFDPNPKVYDSRIPVKKEDQGDCGSWSARSVGNRLLYLHSGLGAIFDLENEKTGSHFSHYSTDISIVAQGLNKPLGFVAQQVGEEDVIFVAERFGHAIKAVPPNSYGIDMRYVPPVATGFREPSCLRFSSDAKEMYVCDFAGGVVWKVDFDRSLLEKK